MGTYVGEGFHSPWLIGHICEVVHRCRGNEGLLVLMFVSRCPVAVRLRPAARDSTMGPWVRWVLLHPPVVIAEDGRNLLAFMFMKKNRPD